ncbi:MAG: HAD hydrolase-like protein [Candidatus Thermoplasmatota archaeon]|nr:HAD hydrolase-like protein [Candidatus Thermoplasmatota archaeon]
MIDTALKKAECTGNESIYIGDKIDRDVAGGKNVGMKTILFSNSHLNNSSDCPDFITDELNKIPDIVKKLIR